VGLSPAPTAALVGGSPADNAALVEGVVAGSDRGPRRDVVLLNAGAAFLAAGRAPDIAQGVALAAATIDRGAVAALLARLRAEKVAADRTRPATPEVPA
jgi:anthranilate phosphoribosyltransferase